jgi:hypothetical protein
VARSGDNSSNMTRMDSASAATVSTIAECRSRSGHGENNEEEDEGASSAIWPASPLISSSDVGISTLSHISGLAGRTSVEAQSCRLTQPL